MAPPPRTEADDDARETLQAALDVFNGPCSTSVPTGGRQELKGLAEKQKQAAAKAALLASSSGGSDRPLPEDERRGVVFSLEQSTIALCSYCHGFTADAGPSLAKSLKQLCGAVVRPTQELVDNLANGDAEGLRKDFGLVWGACDELVRGPLDNKACLFRQLADVMQGMKAAAKELDELVESSRQELATAADTQQQQAAEAGSSGSGSDSNTHGASSNGGAGAVAGRGEMASGAPAGAGQQPAGGAQGVNGRKEEAGQGGDDESEEADDEADDSDDFRDMGTLSAAELRTAECAAALLAAAQGALRVISRPLLEGPAVTSSHCLDDWESLAWHAGKLRSSCEALVACLYPPHDEVEELRGWAEAVANSLELMLAEVPDAYSEGAVPQQLEAAQREVDVAAGKMTDALERLSRPAGAAGV